ncbi:MAG: hypothetical protein ACLGIF_00665 [Actinomycetes bacterium]
MGELRLYAIGVEEMCGMFGAPPEQAERLRALAGQAFAAPVPAGARSGGLIGKLGPLFRRVPAAPVVSPTDPEPRDVEALLAGAYVPHDRTGATWRVLEVLVSGTAWGSTKVPLTSTALDELDFALARGGVPASVGLRHLLNSSTSVNLLPVQGLTVGWHPFEKVLAMTAAYRSALDQLPTAEQRDLVAALVGGLEGFLPWSRAAATSGRPAPDLVGFWAG